MKETAIDILEKWLLESADCDGKRLNMSVKMLKYHFRKAKEFEKTQTEGCYMEFEDLLYCLGRIEYRCEEDYKKSKKNN